MNLGENIYHYRTANNMSQGALAAALEVSRQSVSKWENNTSVPELDKLLKMSDLFGITLDELVHGPKTPAAAPQQPAVTVAPAIAYPPPRVMGATAMLLFGMVFFLLSVFWGNHLRFGEEFGELVSITIVLISLATLSTYNGRVLFFCASLYFLYSLVCFGIMHVTSLTNYAFIFLAGMVIVVWFLAWGTHAKCQEDE